MSGQTNAIPEVVVRAAETADLVEVQAIYEDEVSNGSASFEIQAPDLKEMTARWTSVRSLGLPYLVVLKDKRLAGYAYALPYRSRPGYRYTLEHSVYVARDCRRCRLGSLLLDHLVNECRSLGARQLVGIIGDSDNVASIRLHLRAGFVHVGTLKDVGWKFGRWLDSVIMQKALGEDRGAPMESVR
ncbi:MAG: GNAT family N-acetyltransferase [Gammaproteobacteria bacterium]